MKNKENDEKIISSVTLTKKKLVLVCLFVWPVCLFGLFGLFVWLVCVFVWLVCLFGLFVCLVCLACLFVWLVWLVCLACLFVCLACLAGLACSRYRCVPKIASPEARKNLHRKNDIFKVQSFYFFLGVVFLDLAS